MKQESIFRCQKCGKKDRGMVGLWCDECRGAELSNHGCAKCGAPIRDGGGGLCFACRRQK